MPKQTAARLVSTLLIASLMPVVASAGDTKQADADSSRLLGSVTAAYRSGSYGTSQTARIESLTTDLDWSATDSTTLSLSLPFLIQQAPRGTVGGGGRDANAHRGSNRSVNTSVITTSGIGDLVLGVDQEILEQSSENPVDIGAFAEAKFGTADVAKGLGSGKNDYSIGGRLGHSWDQYYVAGELGYTVVGKPGTVIANGVSTTLDYRNVVFGSVSGAYELNERTTLGAELRTSQSYERGFSSTNTLSADAIYRVTKNLKLKGVILGGLTSDSPDLGFSLTAGWAF